MNVQPGEAARVPDAVPSWAPIPGASKAHPHAGLLHGATLTGEAVRRHLAVRIGLWLDEGGWVRQARWRADDDAALRECAEAACELLEAGIDPARLDADALRKATGAAHGDRVEVVAAAVAAALLLCADA